MKSLSCKTWQILHLNQTERTSFASPAAQMLRENKNYQQIQADTGASSATISRVNKCLLYGSGGYATALEQMGKEQEDG